MMQLVFDQLDLPEAWDQLPILYVNTPRPDGLKRPHTEHTLLYWLASHPKAGSLLVMSNQPFVCRQDALLRFYLPFPFTIETVGEELSFEYYAHEKKATAVLFAELSCQIKIYTRCFEVFPPYCLVNENRLYKGLPFSFNKHFIIFF